MWVEESARAAVIDNDLPYQNIIIEIVAEISIVPDTTNRMQDLAQNIGAHLPNNVSSETEIAG